MELGKLGILGLLDTLSSAETGQFAQKIERLGYSALWFPEQLGREVFSFASYLLSQTERLIVGTGSPLHSPTNRSSPRMRREP